MFNLFTLRAGVQATMRRVQTHNNFPVNEGPEKRGTAKRKRVAVTWTKVNGRHRGPERVWWLSFRSTVTKLK
jgi:hypothetical protein